MQRAKKCLALLLSLLLAVSLLPTVSLFGTAAEIVDTGACGENLTWTLDSDGLLTISGEGGIQGSPWNENNRDRIRSLMIESGVTGIWYGAFSDCANLASVTLADSVTSIERNAFLNTAWYNAQPDGLVYAGKVAYQYKGRMPENTSIILKDGTLGLAGYAFSGCGNLVSVSIPDSVTTIGEYAFLNCTGLSSVTIPGGVATIRKSAFANCDALSAVILREGVRMLGSQVFFHCVNLTCVTLPDSLTLIGFGAFSKCESLTDVYFTGDEAQWAAIEVQASNDLLLNAEIHYNAKAPAESVKELDGSVYTLPEQQAEALLALIGEGASLLNADGSAAAADSKVGSGMVLVKADGTEETVIVKGDNDGDGKITAADARNALRAAVGLDSPNEWQTNASLVGENDKITAAEARLILRAAVGLETLKLY